jgi:hypothetical protein
MTRTNANLAFAGNSFDGGTGNNTLDLTWVLGAAAKIDLAAGQLYIAHSPDNALRNFNKNIGTAYGNDSWIYGRGSRVYTGVGGADSFLFTKRHGAEVITDFNGDDTITLKSFGKALNGFAKVLAHGTDTGGNVVIDTMDGGSLTLLRTTKAALLADDFLFA